ERQAQAAERLKRLQIRVFDRQVGFQALCRRRDEKSLIRQRCLQRSSNFRSPIRRRIDEKEPIAFLPREGAKKVVLGQQQLALENAILKEPNNPEPNGLPLVVLNFYLFSQIAV